MKQEKKLEKYLKDNLIKGTVEDGYCSIGEKIYSIIDNDEKLFDEELNFLPEFDEDGAVYEFGGRWYIQEGDKVSLKELLYIGKAEQKLNTSYFLGVHSGNELMNAVGMYDVWTEKAKFLGVKALGICERNSLVGVIDFQEMCKKAGIKPIFGMSLSVFFNDTVNEIKLYIKDFDGWNSLLKINQKLNVDEEKVSKDFLLDNLEGLILVVDPKKTKYKELFIKPDYYQLDTVKFSNSDVDEDYLKNLELFLKGNLRPVLITDAYYPDKQDFIVREMLWKIGKKFDQKSDNQHFKTNDEVAIELSEMFDNKSWMKLYYEAIKNLKTVVDACNFEYALGNRFMPEYKMTDEEKEKYNTNSELFIGLVKSGLSKKIKNKKDLKKYIKRLEIEIDVLKRGNVIDYFLILHDILSAMRKDGVLIGVGRGSAGGSLVSYLLDLVKLNPLEHNLLFERFLNKGRMGNFEDWPAFSVETDKGTIQLNDGAIVSVMREGEKKTIFAKDLKPGDDILQYKNV